MNTKNLIVHADDFGLTPGISRGILQAIRQGVVSSTSVIIETPYLSTTKKLIKNNPDVDWGIHVVIENPTQPLDRYITNETERQIALFQKYFRKRPSHIDFHKGFQFNTKIYFALRMLVLKHGLAFRYDNRHGVVTDFYGFHNRTNTIDCIHKQSLIHILSRISPGFTELVCHPGNTSGRLADPYRAQRSIELATLTHPDIRRAIKTYDIRLSTFIHYARLSTI